MTSAITNPPHEQDIPSSTHESTMSLSPLPQDEAQLNGQPNSPIHRNGHGIQTPPVKKIGDEQHAIVPVVSIDADTDEERSFKSAAYLYSSSLNGNEPTLINGSQHPPTPNMQAVHVDSPGLGPATIPTTATSISAALVPPPPTDSSSPLTPTPMSFMFYQQRRHPAQLDPRSTMEILPESTSNSNTPTLPSSSFGVDGGDSKKGDEGSKPGTKIIIPDSSSSSTNPNPNLNLSTSSTPSTSRPSSTSIDPNLFSNRPAPPSPSLSRRVSGAPSVASTSSAHSRSRSRSSRPPSLGMSRTNSLRMSGVGSDAKRQSLGSQLSQFMAGSVGTMTASPLGSPHKLTFALNSQSPTQSSSAQSTNLPCTSISSSIISDPTASDSVSVPTPTTAKTPPLLSSTPPSPPPPIPLPATPHVYIKVRDFGFSLSDERHLGLGPDVPKANRVQRLNRKLGGPDRARAREASGSRRTDSIGSMGSVDSSDADAEEREEEDEGWGIGISGWSKGGGGKGWDGFRMGNLGRFSWTMGSSKSNNVNSNNRSENENDNVSKGTSSNGTFPSRKDLDMNFMDSSSSSSDEEPRATAEQGITEEFYDDDDGDSDSDFGQQNSGDKDEQEPLYPGFYRALYAFEPEGTAEMKLDEDQIVRVIGRGGGVGWAVVVDDRGSNGIGDGVSLKHALVPEGYLEAVRLDWEDEEEGSVDDGDGDVKEVEDA